MSRIGQAVQWTVRDVRWGLRQWFVCSVAGSALVPRLVRNLIYRVSGLKVHALNVLPGVRIVGRRLEIGTGSFLNHDSYLDAAGGITVGSNCAIGPEVMILTSTHAVDGHQWSREVEHLSVTIGDNVWLGARCVVLPGTTISDGCMVTVGSVVRGHLNTPGVWGGTPARRLTDFHYDKSGVWTGRPARLVRRFEKTQGVAETRPAAQ